MRSIPNRSGHVARGRGTRRFGLTAALVAALLGGCATSPPRPPVAPGAPVAATAAPTTAADRARASLAGLRFEAVAWGALPGWYSDPLDAALPALLESCEAMLAGRGAGAAETRGGRARTGAQAWAEPCEQARALGPQPDAASLRAWLQQHLQPWRMWVEETDGGPRDQGLVTGYFEPLLRGSRTPDARFRHPLYGPPDDLITVDLGELYPALRGQRVRGRLQGRTLVPYWSRAQIDAGQASLRGRELLWVDDPMDAFFLEIQGSGRVELPDGTRVRLGYADQNGHPYRAIGRVLVDAGELTVEQASMQGIRGWARANPDKLRGLLHANPSVVFFRELPPLAKRPGRERPEGPPGALGVPLTTLRSVAVDPRAVPLGAPLWLATRDPVDGAAIERLAFAQDTGGAIVGALRIDLFWGFGERAALAAGQAREPGRLWLLLPRGVDPRSTLDAIDARAGTPRVQRGSSLPARAEASNTATVRMRERTARPSLSPGL